MSDKQRIIDLQRQVSIARSALQKIEHGAQHPHMVAEDALYEMLKGDKPTPLAGVLGWKTPSP